MKGRLYILILLLFISCISPLDVNIERDEFLLVVEGFVSTEKKAHSIRLTRSAKYGTIFEGVIRNIVGASVALRDQDGNITEFIEQGSGRYFSPDDFGVVVGNTYTLLIDLLDGNHYATMPETVREVPPITDLKIRYKKNPTSDPLRFTSGVEVYAEFQDPESERNYYYWENGGTYLIETFPELYLAPGIPPTPAPKDCCATCWVSEINSDMKVRISNDVFTNGNTSTELAAFIKDDGGRFMDKYMVRIRQYSQSKEAHQFFSLLNEQLSIDGDIFDAPPGQIRGNFYNIDDFEEPIIGYFWVGDVAIDSVFIPRNTLVETQPLREIWDDCRVLKGSSSEKPDYWN